MDNQLNNTFQDEKYDIALHGLWNTNNFGAVLTSWALYQILRKSGKRVVLIDYRNKTVPTNSSLYQFMSNRCMIAGPYYRQSDLIGLNRYFDTFMIGSDQCWREVVTGYYGYPFLLDYVYDSKIKISYATSFANDHYEGDEERIREVKYYLKRFDDISVRESGGVDLCSRMFQVNAVHAIDPVFLLPKEEYNEIIKESTKEPPEQYALKLFLDLDHMKCSYGESIKEKYHLNGALIHSVGGTNTDLIIDHDLVEDVTLPDYLKYISKSKYVITDSFHGMCFAILYQIPFTVILNRTRGSARFYSMLQILGLEDRMIYDDHIIDPDKMIEWDAVNEKINRFKLFSHAWLMNAIDKAVIKDMTYHDFFLNRISVLEDKVIRLEQLVIGEREAAIRRYFSKNLKGSDQVLIRGGGYHTQMLLALLDDILKKMNISIIAIVDQDKKKGKINGKEYKVILPEQISEYEFNSIIISSGIHRAEFISELREIDPMCNILDLYGLYEPDETINMPSYYGY